MTFAIAWLRCDAAGAACAAIAGAVGAAYTLTADDVGHTIRSRVTASTASGATQASSSPTGVVTAAGGTGNPGGGNTGGTGGGVFGGGVPSPPNPGAAGAPDTAAPVVSLTFKKLKLAALLKKGLTVTVSCSEGCDIAAVLTQAATRKRGKVTMLSAGGVRPQKAAAPGTRACPSEGEGEGHRPRHRQAGRARARRRSSSSSRPRPARRSSARAS